VASGLNEGWKISYFIGRVWCLIVVGLSGDGFKVRGVEKSVDNKKKLSYLV
jgi:hypothetical protein